MKILNSFIIIYIISGILYLLSTILNYNLLGYIAKPIFIGVLCVYYINKSKDNFNYEYFTVLILLFLSGMINLLEGKDNFKYVLFLNFCAYSFFLYILVKKLAVFKLEVMQKNNFSAFLLILIFFLCLIYISRFIVFDTSFEMYKFMYAYDFLLTAVGVCSTLLYLVDSSTKNTYLILAVLNILICEICYGIYYYYYPFLFFRYTSVLCYIVSFYFLVNYFLNANEHKKEA